MSRAKQVKSKDRIGTRVGTRVIVGITEKRHGSHMVFETLCDCGRVQLMSLRNIKLDHKCRQCAKLNRKPADLCKMCQAQPGSFYSKCAKGDFCSRHCARRFSTFAKRGEINERISLSMRLRKINAAHDERMRHPFPVVLV